ncbi:flagellar assembly protein FliW [Marinisporobacter balticus]|uniref:Flagellar assembly factor FliW n=1 Tax=Marinisporobacter balticus TaxID=2018667 RepID=A0A4R2KUH6_9FIRM|nr:flagellar assembly protein FliW [Marinisporobacter balticus]TCO76467.1 flagellar assembly factor FliW [Marinisporobacter balticus]
MIIQTRHFGEIEIKDETIINFPEGIPAFEDFKQYVVIKNPDTENDFHWLQCVDNSDLTFVVVNPFEIKEDYDFEIPDRIVKQLQIEKYEDVMILSIIVIPENVEKITANLKAPVIINIHKKIGKQFVLEDERYPLKYYIFQEKKG